MTTPDPRGAQTPGHDLPGSGGSGTDPAAGTAAAPSARPPAASSRGAGRSIGLGLAAALLVFVTVVLVLFVMFNTQTVQISLVFGEVQAPLVMALLIAAALGGLLVLLVGAVLGARRHKR